MTIDFSHSHTDSEATLPRGEKGEAAIIINLRKWTTEVTHFEHAYKWTAWLLFRITSSETLKFLCDDPRTIHHSWYPSLSCKRAKRKGRKEHKGIRTWDSNEAGKNNEEESGIKENNLRQSEEQTRDNRVIRNNRQENSKWWVLRCW